MHKGFVQQSIRLQSPHAETQASPGFMHLQVLVPHGFFLKLLILCHFMGYLLNVEFNLQLAWSLINYTKINILLIWRIMCILIIGYNPTRHSKCALHRLTVPYYKYKQYKAFTLLSNSFFYSAPQLWKSLSETINVLLCLVCFMLFWRHLSGQSNVRPSFITITIFQRPRTILLIIRMTCVSRKRFAKIRHYRSSTD